MNPLTNQQRDTAYESATNQQLYLYENPESGAALMAIANKHNLSSSATYTTFAIAIGDVILGLVPQEKLPDLLIERLQITRPEAMKVTADILDFLAPLSQTQPAAKPPVVSSGTQPTPTAIPRKPQPDTALADEIMATEIELESAVQPMRTMAHDMETARNPQPASADVVHQASSQSDLLSGNKTKNSSATWNTTQAS